MTATAAPESITVARANAPHVAVIGAGLAGLVTALRLRRAGARVTLVTKGVGGLQLGHGFGRLVRQNAGEAAAQAQEAMAAALSKNASLVDYERARRWNGQLPQNVYAGAPIPFLQAGH